MAKMTVTFEREGEVPKNCAECIFWMYDCCPIHLGRAKLLKRYLTSKPKNCPIVVKD